MPVKMQCPKCGHHSVDPAGATAHCSPCTYRWRDWVSFYIEMGSKGKKISYKEFEEPEAEPNYIESGEFAQDIENLVQAAVEKAVALERIAMLDKFIYDTEEVMNARGVLSGAVVMVDSMRTMLREYKDDYDRKYGDD